MGDSSFIQHSFLGGEWSAYAQGRSDLPAYRTALNQCQNAIPVEESSCVRRPGTPELGPTLYARPGLIRRFEVADNNPILVEFTYGGGVSALRFWWFDGYTHRLLHNDTATVLAVSTANPAVMQTSAAVTWATGDIVFIQVDQSVNSNIGPQLANRQFVLTKIDTTHFALADTFTGTNLNGAALNAAAGLGGTVAKRVVVLAGPWTSLTEVQQVDFVQADLSAYIFSSSRLPYVLTYNSASSTVPFTLADAGFAAFDGPYLDPLAGTSQTKNDKGKLTAPSITGAGGIGAAGNATFETLDAGYTFTGADVGRCIRLWNQPPAWDSTLTYANGDRVTSAGAYWQRDPGTAPGVIQALPGNGVPYTDPGHTTVTVFPWGEFPNIASWAYGVITALVSASKVTVALSTSLDYWSATGPITDIGNGPIIDTWQLGAYVSGHYPICGTFHEGRLWASGAYPNRFDGSQPIKVLTSGANQLQFSPTERYGQVTASNAINYTVDSPGVNKFLWMQPDHGGILAGTKSGEWLISATTQNEPLTPTSVQAHRTSGYKSSAVRPVRIGQSLIFAQASGRRVMEYSPDNFSSGRFTGRHLNKFAKHISKRILELAYQEELAPILWLCDTDGALVGCTYRHVREIGAEEVPFYAWHKHPIANRSVISLSSSATAGGTLDTLAMMTTDANGKYYAQLMAPLFDVNDPITLNRHLDHYYTGYALAGSGGVSGYDPSLYGGASGIKLNGMANKAGQTVTVLIAGLDCGDYTVAADGSVTLAYRADPDGLLTAAYLAGLNSATAYAELSTVIEVNDGGKERLIVPVLVGQSYTTQCQIVRPETQEEVRGKTGPGLAETRRVFKYGAKLANAVGVSMGTNVSNLRPVPLTQDNGTALDHATMFTGVVRGEVDDDYSYDGMLMWQISRPYPCTMVAIAPFLETAEIP